MLPHSCAIVSVAALAMPLAAEVTLVGQQRVVEAFTTFDNQTQTASAVAFEPFQVTVNAGTPFPATGGGTGTNEAIASINCLVDPNAISAAGSLAAAGGFAVVGGQPSPVFGEAGAIVVVSFIVDVPTVYHLTAAPRPSDQPGDEFELDLSNLSSNAELFRISEVDPPQSVDLTGVLQPATYQVLYQVELTGGGATADVQYGFGLTLSSPCGTSDIGRAGGVEGSDNRLDNNDFIVFITHFFEQAASADIGQVGGVSGADGVLDNNDFIVFVASFFDGDAVCR